ncbi:alpha/beta-hydrolase [Obba rivulosa]|uniref:Alpha/beta-hydrolase n=1 Tax=Obba rivulosa TaxID=1052685 RepID=A0A8E2AVL9_9APHY|nr:alpha/beta-hydrolase [Obba rivulosa]
MDPANPSSFNHRTELLSTGRRYHFVDQIPDNFDAAATETLLLVHGFPDCWYGWRHQIGPWTRQGYRVVVPDMLGYGGTDKPKDAEEYTSKKLCADLAALLDFVGVRQAVVIGHDWGSFVVNRFALWQSDRLKALVLLSIPYIPPAKEYVSLEATVQQAPDWGYQLYFADQQFTAEIEGKLELFLKFMFSQRRPGAPPTIPFTKPGQLRKLLMDNSDLDPNRMCFLSKEESAYYVEQLRNMQGPLNYYRTTRLRFDEEQAANLPFNLSASLPVLYIGGTRDPTARLELVSRTKPLAPRLQDEYLEGKGHWIMVEAQIAITERIPAWLQELGLGSAKGAQTKL